MWVAGEGRRRWALGKRSGRRRAARILRGREGGGWDWEQIEAEERRGGGYRGGEEDWRRKRGRGEKIGYEGNRR